MPVLDEKIQKQLADIFKNLKNGVRIIFFTQENECDACRGTRMFLEEISPLAEKIALEVFDFVNDKEKADSYGIDKVPAIIILDAGGSDTGIRFFGLPGGYEINSFITSILETSGQRQPLDGKIIPRIAAINKPVHLEVFIIPT